MEYTEDEMKQIQLQQQMFENTPLPGDKNVDKLMKSMIRMTGIGIILHFLTHKFWL